MESQGENQRAEGLGMQRERDKYTRRLGQKRQMVGGSDQNLGHATNV